MRLARTLLRWTRRTRLRLRTLLRTRRRLLLLLGLLGLLLSGLLLSCLLLGLSLSLLLLSLLLSHGRVAVDLRVVCQGRMVRRMGMHWGRWLWMRRHRVSHSLKGVFKQ